MTETARSPSTAGPAPIVMHVSFDVDQYSDLLCWVVTEDNRDLMRTNGVFAGTLHFERAAPMSFTVRGWGGDDLLSFQVLSATLVTIPASPSLPPSPLDGVGAATFTMTGFPPSDSPRKDGDRWYMDVTGPTTARVVDVNGGWHLKMVLTVQYTRRSATDPTGQVTGTRVFYFDPEGQVGDGTR